MVPVVTRKMLLTTKHTTLSKSNNSQNVGTIGIKIRWAHNQTNDTTGKKITCIFYINVAFSTITPFEPPGHGCQSKSNHL